MRDGSWLQILITHYRPRAADIVTSSLYCNKLWLGGYQKRLMHLCNTLADTMHLHWSPPAWFENTHEDFTPAETPAAHLCSQTKQPASISMTAVHISTACSHRASALNIPYYQCAGKPVMQATVHI